MLNESPTPETAAPPTRCSRGGAERSGRPSATWRGSPRSASARSRRRSTTMAASARRRATKVIAVGQGARLPAERPRPEPASRPEPHRRADHRRTPSAASPSRSWKGSRSASPTAAWRSSCATPPTIRSARRGTSNRCIGKRVDGIVVTGRRADRRPRCMSLRRNIPVIYVYSQIDDPDAFCLVPDDEGGAVLADRASRRTRPAADRACHRAGAVRGRAAPARRLSQDARRGRARRAGGLLSARRLVGGLGTRGGRPALPRPPSAARCDLLRQRPDRARRRRCAARARRRRARTRCRWSASTIGRSSPRRRGRRSPRST